MQSFDSSVQWKPWDNHICTAEFCFWRHSLQRSDTKSQPCLSHEKMINNLIMLSKISWRFQIQSTAWRIAFMPCFESYVWDDWAYGIFVRRQNALAGRLQKANNIRWLWSGLAVYDSIWSTRLIFYLSTCVRRESLDRLFELLEPAWRNFNQRQ